MNPQKTLEIQLPLIVKTLLDKPSGYEIHVLDLIDTFHLTNVDPTALKVRLKAIKGIAIQEREAISPFNWKVERY